MIRAVIPVIALLIGIIIGVFLPVQVTPFYARYIAIVILVALDTIFGGIRTILESTFDATIFLSGFFVNSLLGVILIFMGDRLGVDLYLAAIVAFGVRIFQNLAVIRRYVIRKLSLRSKEVKDG